MESLFTWLLPLVNALGLGLLGWGLFHLYRTLLDRNKSLEDHIKEVKTGHVTVVEVMQRRAEELERRFDDEKRWRTNIIGGIRETSGLRTESNLWKSGKGPHALAAAFPAFPQVPPLSADRKIVE